MAGYRWLHRVAIGVHAITTLWLMINGVGHSFAVVVRSRAGALRPETHVASLLAIGAGLIATGIVFAATLRPLVRRRAAMPAIWAVFMLAILIALIAARYGFMFLGGAIAFGLTDLAVLVSFSVAERAQRVPGERE